MGLLTAMQEGIYPTAKQNLSANAAFDIGTAGVLAWASQLAYEVLDQEKVNRILRRWGWQRPIIFAERFASHLPLVSTKGFAAVAGEDTVIAFAGTEPTRVC